MSKIQVVLFLIAANTFGSLAFWSLDTDLQLGYEIYDRSYEINALIQGIAAAAARSSVIQSDDSTRRAVASLQALASQLRSSPVQFFNEIGAAAANRYNNEAWIISRIRSNHANYDKTLDSLRNVTGTLSGLSDVSNPSIVATLHSSLEQIQEASKVILESAEGISRDISRARANSSLLLTPELLGDFIDPNSTQQIVSALVSSRNGYARLALAVRDAARLTVAHGSVHELLSRSFSRDNSTRSAALNNFVNNYNRVRNNLLSSVASYRQAAESGIYNFVARVQANYHDTIVRPKFDSVQLPIIKGFANVITSQVYNQTYFQSQFDGMRDEIINYFNSASASATTDQREAILGLQKTLFVRNYSTCMDQLVTEAQQTSNSITGKHAFCLNERTSGIVVVIPSTSTWMSVIRDNINFILQQLNACLNGQSTVAGRTGVSDCIQFNANNLPFYSAYLPLTVQSNLGGIIQNTPLMFKSCISLIATSDDSRFEEIYEKCKSEVQPAPTTEEPTTPEATTADATTVEPWTTTETETTVEPEYGSGESEFTELTDSYILV